MNFGFQALVRCLFVVLAAIIYLPALHAQQSAGFGTATKPNTVVYKLKQAPAGANARAAKPDALQRTLQKLGSKQNRQKFTSSSVASSSVRKSGPSSVLLIYELQHSPTVSFEQVKRELMATGLVAYVEPLYLREPLHQPNDFNADSTKNTQYYLKLIQAYSGWEAEKGDTTVVIGVLDTGFNITHPDLKEKIHYNVHDPVDGLDNDGDGYVDNYTGWDFADFDNNVYDTPHRNHGTGVAGVATAQTNNSIGIAGVGYNIKFMPIKVFTNSGYFNAGYEAMVYAAEMGAKVINLSWGGLGYSQFEQDIIDYLVLELDVAVIAAAGNSNGNRREDIYPASYRHVISVGGTDQTDIKLSDFTYSYKVDITAPSKDIFTTFNSSYSTSSGTSYGSPMVAACAALVRSRFPELNAIQVMERVRASSDDIYHLQGNIPYLEMLGRGRLNVKRALKATNLKSVRSISFKTEQDRPLQSGLSNNIVAAFTNYLDPLQDLTITLTSTSPYVTIENPNLSIGSMATSGTAHNTNTPFRITVSPDAPANTYAHFRIGYSDGTYTDYEYVDLLINPAVITLSTDNLRISFNGKGNLGYDGLNTEQGVGFTYKSNSSLLYEGGLMIAASSERVSDNVHINYWGSDDNFIPFSPAKIRYNTPQADQVIMGAMKDKHPASANAGVEVKYRSYSWNTPGNKDYVIVEYQVKNITTETIASLHAGLFADWDIGTYYENAADWDADRKLGYVYSKAASMPYTGIRLLTEDEVSYYAIGNDGNTVGIYDNFTDAEKYKSLSSSVTQAQAGTAASGDNVSHVVGTVAKDLAPGQVKTIAFAILAGDNLEALQLNSDAAQLKYSSIKSGPAPLVYEATICTGATATWTPEGGENFHFYADAEKTVLLGTGRSFSLENFTQEQRLYATNADSLFESAVGAALFSLPVTSEIDFEATSNKIYAGIPATFQSKSSHSNSFTWKFSEADIQGGESTTYTFPAPGIYEVSLTASDNNNCTIASLTKQVKVIEAKPGPAPLALYDTICVGSTAVWAPEGGRTFNFYADSEKTTLIGSGASYSAENIREQTTIYAANADSVIESTLSPAVFSVHPFPLINFDFDSDKIYPGIPVTFASNSSHAKDFTWNFGTSDGQHTGPTATYAFPAPGIYQVTLNATDNFNCSTASIAKQVEVLEATPAALEEAITLYPNPARRMINLTLLPEAGKDKMPAIFLTDTMGKTIKPAVELQSTVEAVVSLKGLAAGLYHVHIHYRNTRIIRRIVVL